MTIGQMLGLLVVIFGIGVPIVAMFNRTATSAETDIVTVDDVVFNHEFAALCGPHRVHEAPTKRYMVDTINKAPQEFAPWVTIDSGLKRFEMLEIKIGVGDE